MTQRIEIRNRALMDYVYLKRIARTVATDDADGFALSNLERDVAERPDHRRHAGEAPAQDHLLERSSAVPVKPVPHPEILDGDELPVTGSATALR